MPLNFPERKGVVQNTPGLKVRFGELIPESKKRLENDLIDYFKLLKKLHRLYNKCGMANEDELTKAKAEIDIFTEGKRYYLDTFDANDDTLDKTGRITTLKELIEFKFQSLAKLSPEMIDSNFIIIPDEELYSIMAKTYKAELKNVNQYHNIELRKNALESTRICYNISFMMMYRNEDTIVFTSISFKKLYEARNKWTLSSALIQNGIDPAPIVRDWENIRDKVLNHSSKSINIVYYFLQNIYLKSGTQSAIDVSTNLEFSNIMSCIISGNLIGLFIGHLNYLETDFFGNPEFYLREYATAISIIMEELDVPMKDINIETKIFVDRYKRKNVFTPKYLLARKIIQTLVKNKSAILT